MERNVEIMTIMRIGLISVCDSDANRMRLGKAGPSEIMDQKGAKTTPQKFLQGLDSVGLGADLCGNSHCIN